MAASPSIVVKKTSFTQTDVTRFYDSLVFPSRAGASAYSVLASDTLKNGWRVGDFGCGQSVFYSVFRDLTPKPVFLDISFNALQTIDYGSKIQADLCRLPLKASLFDAIFCIGVIHHLPEIKAALAELMRVINTDGLLVIGVYSPDSAGARVKRAYDTLNAELARKIVFWGAILLLWAKLRGRFKVSWQDARKRISDLLDTPVVNYLSSDDYERIAAQAGLETVDRRQICSMTILLFKKVRDGVVTE